MRCEENTPCLISHDRSLCRTNQIRIENCTCIRCFLLNGSAYKGLQILPIDEFWTHLLITHIVIRDRERNFELLQLFCGFISTNTFNTPVNTSYNATNRPSCNNSRIDCFEFNTTIKRWHLFWCNQRSALDCRIMLIFTSKWLASIKRVSIMGDCSIIIIDSSGYLCGSLLY